MRRLLHALSSTLVATSAAAAEHPPEVWFSPCSAPMATCVRPVSMHSQKESCDGCSSQPAAEAGPRRLRPTADSTRDVLDRWEEASKAFYPVTEAERLRLRAERPDLTGQQIELVCALKQSVRSDDLTRRYDWATLREKATTVSLVATPKDRLEHLFYKQFVVELDHATGRPRQVRFGTDIPSENVGAPTVTLRPWLDQSQLDLQLVGYESRDNQPRLLRTVDASVDAPQRLPIEKEIKLIPPAPEPFDCDEP